MDFSAQRQRRTRVLDQMRALGGGVALVPTAPEIPRNADNSYPFRFDSNFFYLTGFPEPEALLVLVASESPQSILFCRSKHAEREIWDGYRYGPEAALLAFGIDQTFAIEEMDEEIPKLLANQPALFYAMGAQAGIDQRILRWLETVRARERSGTTAPAAVFDIRPMLAEMRLVKDVDEIATMRQAAQISAAAHIRAMQATRPGRHEYEVEAELLAEFRRRGAQSPAYGSIVAGGAGACVLHYLRNDQLLRDGDLLLVDAGCELDGYASDITRTFPVGGRFSSAQRELYDLVLDAQSAAIAATRAGVRWNEPHDAAVEVLAQGMLDLGLLEGTLSEVLESASYRKFYMHRTGHWLGLDVHDVGDYREIGPQPEVGERPWRVLVPGMVVTVEPGLYVRAEESVPERFWNQGIRIEDDVLVTETNREVLSSGVPKSVQEIESLMRG